MNACLQAADDLAAEGRALEVIDLRSLQPWDEAAVVASVRRTGRLLIAHEAVTAFGVGAEIAATITQRCFADLKAAPARVGAPFMPIPFARNLERAYTPDRASIAAAARQLLS